MNNFVVEPLLNKREFVREIIAPTGWGKRLANWIIDLIVSSVLVGGLAFCFGMVWTIAVDETALRSLDEIHPLLDRILTFILRVILYYIPMEYFLGRTVGKMITRTKVVTRDGENAALGDIIVRNLTRIVGIEIFSFLSENPIGWHDKAGNTLVVDDIPLYDLNETTNTDFSEEERY